MRLPAACVLAPIWINYSSGKTRHLARAQEHRSALTQHVTRGGEFPSTTVRLSTLLLAFSPCPLPTQSNTAPLSHPHHASRTMLTVTGTSMRLFTLMHSARPVLFQPKVTQLTSVMRIKILTHLGRCGRRQRHPSHCWQCPRWSRRHLQPPCPLRHLRLPQ